MYSSTPYLLHRPPLYCPHSTARSVYTSHKSKLIPRKPSANNSCFVWRDLLQCDYNTFLLTAVHRYTLGPSSLNSHAWVIEYAPLNVFLLTIYKLLYWTKYSSYLQYFDQFQLCGMWFIISNRYSLNIFKILSQSFFFMRALNY